LWPFDLIRKACRCHREAVERERPDRQYELGYRLIAEDLALAEAQAEMIAEILEEEQW
jgi:hypothetical protein